jgi:hypothetical protein
MVASPSIDGYQVCTALDVASKAFHECGNITHYYIYTEFTDILQRSAGQKDH